MHSHMTSLGAAVVWAILMLVAPAPAGEKSIAMDKVPLPVLQAVKARFPDGQVTGAAQEMDEGKLVYELSVKQEGRNIDVTLSPQGQIVLFEAQIAAKDLPPAVAKALAAKFPKATYKIVEKVVKIERQKEKLAYYEVLLVNAEKKKLGVQVGVEGKIGEIEEK